MGSNLEIINDWVKGNNPRPVSINFHTDKAVESQNKNATPIGGIYEDKDGKRWKRVGENTWSRVDTILDFLKETNPDCKSCGCEIDYKHRYNVTAYQKSKMCFDCMVEDDTQKKINGTFKLYEQKFVFERQRDYVIDMLAQLKDGLDKVDNNMEFINEFGDREKWSGLDTDKLKEEMKKDISEGEQALIDIAESLERVNSQILDMETK